MYIVLAHVLGIGHRSKARQDRAKIIMKNRDGKKMHDFLGDQSATYIV